MPLALARKSMAGVGLRISYAKSHFGSTGSRIAQFLRSELFQMSKEVPAGAKQTALETSSAHEIRQTTQRSLASRGLRTRAKMRDGNRESKLMTFPCSQIT